MQIPGSAEQAFTVKDTELFDLHKYASEVFGDLKSPLQEKYPATCLKNLENLVIQRDDVKAVVTLYAYIFESKVLIPNQGSGGKRNSGTYTIYRCSTCQAKRISVKFSKEQGSSDCSINILPHCHHPECGLAFNPVRFEGNCSIFAKLCVIYCGMQICLYFA